MKGALDLDPELLDCGPATTGLRRILAEWAEINWFVPPRSTRAEANRLFSAHTALARPHAPELFADSVQYIYAAGDWANFSAQCNLVRNNSQWDWKYTALKKLSQTHSAARGWKLQEQGQQLPNGMNSSGSLFYRLNEHVLWKPLGPFPVALNELPREHSESASFYLSYCHMDLIESLEWQLAENHDDISGNPFVSLLRCYATGFYPFSVSSTSVVMFSFAAAD